MLLYQLLSERITQFFCFVEGFAGFCFLLQTDVADTPKTVACPEVRSDRDSFLNALQGIFILLLADIDRSFLGLEVRRVGTCLDSRLDIL